MDRVRGRDLLAYILSRTGCIHPFRLSRLALFAELEWMREKNDRLTDLTYVAGPGTFYIEGFKEMIENDACFERREGDPASGTPGCIVYRCNPPSLPDEVREHVDKIVSRLSGLSDQELNEKVLTHPLYEKIVTRK